MVMATVRKGKPELRKKGKFVLLWVCISGKGLGVSGLTCLVVTT